MSKVQKVSRDELRAACAATISLPDSTAQDEMAIPSYLHPNPLVRWIVWRRHELIMNLASSESGADILDFGCGPGVLLPTLCQFHARVHAIDLKPGIAQKLCETRGLKVHFHDSIAHVQDRSLDIIIAAEVLEHMESELVPLLQEFRRKLKPSGCLIVSVPVEGAMYRVGRMLAGFGNKAHYHHRRGSEIMEIITGCRYKLIMKKGIPFDFIPSLYVVGKFLPCQVQ